MNTRGCDSWHVGLRIATERQHLIRSICVLCGTLWFNIAYCQGRAENAVASGHSIGNIGVGLNNLGGLANGVNPCDASTLYRVEYPAGSSVEYFQASIWVGAVKGGDTLVSWGDSPWAAGTEFWPTIGELIERASPLLKGQACYDALVDDSAKSDFDVVLWHCDTLDDPARVPTDTYEHRSHRPLGLIIKQSSFSWSSGNGAAFVIVEYAISRIEPNADAESGEITGSLKDVYFGLFGDVTARYPLNGTFGLSDNYTEFIGFSPSPLRPEVIEEFNTVMTFDNDGDPGVAGGHGFGRFSAPDVVGLSLLRKPSDNSTISFNWWIGTWGPVQRYSKVESLDGGLGAPQGDRAAYMLMSNGEVDYPQMEAALDHGVRGWLPPPKDSLVRSLLFDGYAGTFLLSVGPFDLERSDTAHIAIAVVGGHDFHTDPNNFHDFFDPLDPSVYRSQLDPTDLLRKVQWAKWAYDNPGIDTDGDGYAGEWFLRGGDTVYYRGDGVPDIRAALPPRTPILIWDTRTSRIKIRWSGFRTETEDDVFTLRPDFEGYRVYMSRTGQEDDWYYLTQRDLLNYARFTWNPGYERWTMVDPPYSVDSLKALYDDLCDTSYGYPFHPDSFPVPDLNLALLEVRFDPNMPERLDSTYRYFAPYESNNMPDDIGLAKAAHAGVDVAGVIRKVFPEATKADTAYAEDGTPFLPYYEYEYVIKDLQLAEPLFLAVTTFDHGDPASRLEPLESSKRITSRELWPINSAAVVEKERPTPGVYPNPYRLIDDYYGHNWENRKGLEPDQERARQVTFYNVPDTCVVSIYTLDGDLVKRLHHSYPPESSEATVVRWDLITRNTQAIKTGIYIWSVESRFGTDVGKLVVIK